MNSSDGRRIREISAILYAFMQATLSDRTKRELSPILETLRQSAGGTSGTYKLADLIESDVRNRLDGTYESLDRFRYEARYLVRNELEQLISGGFSQGQMRQLLELQAQQQSLLDEQKKIQYELHSYLTAWSLGLDPKDLPLPRLLPVRIYLKEDDSRQIQDVTRALFDFLSGLDFEISDDFPAVQGSWFKKLFVRSKEVVTQPEISERLQKAERALELHGLQKVQAEVDKMQAEAAATLIKALEDSSDGAVQIGSILLLKVTGDNGRSRVVTRTLTQRELIFIEQNQDLLKSPESMLRALAEHCKNNTLLSSTLQGNDDSEHYLSLKSSEEKNIEQRGSLAPTDG